jgi:hypothetical protein
MHDLDARLLLVDFISISLVFKNQQIKLSFIIPKHNKITQHEVHQYTTYTSHYTPGFAFLGR